MGTNLKQILGDSCGAERGCGPYAASNPFRFATKYTDIETGLVQYNTRYYSPSLGRFINRDSIGEAGGLNLYAYVSNRVPNAFDYLGMDPTDADSLYSRRRMPAVFGSPNMWFPSITVGLTGQGEFMNAFGSLTRMMSQLYTARIRAYAMADERRKNREHSPDPIPPIIFTPPTTPPPSEPTEPNKPNVVLPDIATAEGVLARVLLAESRTPFHKEYDEAEVLKAMQMMAAVYENRLKDPSRYGARGADDLVDVIVAPGQTAGFTRNARGEIVLSTVVQRRIDEIMQRANAGEAGAFAALAQNAVNVATGVVESLDPFAHRGGMVAFRTEGSSSPGGNFQILTAAEGGVVGGQQFYILKEQPPPQQRRTTPQPNIEP